jgi:hypothetical protein
MVPVRPVEANMEHRERRHARAERAGRWRLAKPEQRHHERHVHPEEHLLADPVGQPGRQRKHAPLVALDRVELVGEQHGDGRVVQERRRGGG